MIGRVFFDLAGRPSIATLGDDWKWSVEVEGAEQSEIDDMTANLNAIFGLAGYSPADGQPGFLQIHAVAEHFEGRAETIEPPPLDPDVDY